MRSINQSMGQLSYLNVVEVMAPFIFSNREKENVIIFRLILCVYLSSYGTICISIRHNKLLLYQRVNITYNKNHHEFHIHIYVRLSV